MLWALHKCYSFNSHTSSDCSGVNQDKLVGGHLLTCQDGFLGLVLEWLSNHSKMPGANGERRYQKSMPKSVLKVKTLEKQNQSSSARVKLQVNNGRQGQKERSYTNMGKRG